MGAMRFLLSAAIVVAVGLAAVACGSGEEASTSGTTISISETDFMLDPSTPSVDAPGTVTFKVTNDGGTDHAFEIEGHGIEEETDIIKPGDTAELTVDLSESGEYEIYCPVDDHRGKGMEGTLTVGGGGGGGGGGGTGTSTETGTDTSQNEGTTTSGGGYGY